MGARSRRGRAGRARACGGDRTCRRRPGQRRSCSSRTSTFRTGRRLRPRGPRSSAPPTTVYARGDRVKVALIHTAEDLGAIPSLFGQPGEYAHFLGVELGLWYVGPLLVVMPAGFGVYDGGRSTAAAEQVLRSVDPADGEAGRPRPQRHDRRAAPRGRRRAALTRRDRPARHRPPGVRRPRQGGDDPLRPVRRQRPQRRVRARLRRTTRCSPRSPRPGRSGSAPARRRCAGRSRPGSAAGGFASAWSRRIRPGTGADRPAPRSSGSGRRPWGRPHAPTVRASKLREAARESRPRGAPWCAR